MEPTFVVIKRGPSGEPLTIGCAAHAGCDWSVSTRGTKRDDDPLYVALFAQHMRNSAPAKPMMGHARRGR